MSSQLEEYQEDTTSSHKLRPTRSILKQTLSQNISSQFNDPQTSQPQPEAPTSTVVDEDLTSTSQLLNRSHRRVSFAPDVTLHSFDFVVSSTQNAPPTNIPRKEPKKGQQATQPVQHDISQRVEEGQEEDSTSMELTGPINLNKNTHLINQPLEPIQDEPEDMSIDLLPREERMSPISLSFDKYEIGNGKTDGTMELTGSFKQIDEKDSNTMDFTKISFYPDDANTSKSQDMDLTGVQNYSNNTRSSLPLTIERPQEEDETMDLTQIKSHEVFRPPKDQAAEMELTQTHNVTKNNNIRSSEESDDDNELDLTEINIKRTPRTGSDETQMELTQIHKPLAVPNKISTTNPIANNQVADENEMELTGIQFHQIDLSLHQKHSKNNDSNVDGEDHELSMEFTNILRQSIENSNTNVKRLRIDTDNEEMTRQNKIPHTDDPKLSDPERMSPIKLAEIYNEGTFLPERDNYSLTKFLTDINSNFLKEIEDLSISPGPIYIGCKASTSTDIGKKLHLLTSLYCDIPWFQMITFMSNELTTMNEKSELVFNNLQKQISTGVTPPLLLKQYYSASDVEQKNITDQLNIVKLYASLEAKKTWYKWQLSNLENVKVILKDNLSLLRERQELLEGKLIEQQKLNNDIKLLKESIKNEIAALKNNINTNMKELSLENKIKLAKLKRMVELSKGNVIDLPILIRQKQQVDNEISKLRQIVSNLQNKDQDVDISLLEQNKASCNIVRRKLRILENITGIHFIKITNDQITFKVSALNFPLEIHLNESCGSFFSRTLERIRDPFVKLIFANHFSTNYNTQVPTYEVLHVLFLRIRSLLPVIREFNLLRRIFIIHIRRIKERNTEHLIELKCQNFTTRQSVLYQIPVIDFKNFLDDSTNGLTVRASVTPAKQDLGIEQLQTLFTTKTRHIIPLLNDQHVTVTGGLLATLPS